VNEPAAPTVTGIFPNIGSTGGETPLRIAGTGFLPGATATFGGSTVPTRTDPRDPLGTILYVDSPAHAAGAVDVVVTNPTGQPGGMAAGYTYASPGSFDFNGTWSGFGKAGQDIAIEFTIERDALISVSCHTFATLTFSPPPPVVHGEFDYRGDDGVLVSGRIVSESAAVGTLHLAPCTDTRWGAGRQ
jgi:hypothetical protein